nr:uncharacterized mitochondrial protein AtMg00820-like [Tanacetum cinerariifolium]
MNDNQTEKFRNKRTVTITGAKEIVGIQHSEQPESISNTCVVEKVDSNVIPDSLDMCDNDIQTNQNAKDERTVLANLIANLKLDEKHSHDHFRAPTAHDMEILIKTCLMPLAIKTQNGSFKFVHELKQEMHVDLKLLLGNLLALLEIFRKRSTHRFDKIKEMSETSVANDTSGLVLQRQKALDYDNSSPAPQLQNVSPSADTIAPSQQELQVWDLVDKPFGKTVIKLNWLWKNKKDEDQTVNRNKARLVAKGYAQEEGIDFEESFVWKLEGGLNSLQENTTVTGDGLGGPDISGGRQVKSYHWQYKFPLPVKVVAIARRLKMPLPEVCTPIEEKKKKLPVKDRWQLH